MNHVKRTFIIWLVIGISGLGWIKFIQENFPGEAIKAAEYKHEIVRTQKTIYYFINHKSLRIE